jgi:hypothetical protein
MKSAAPQVYPWCWTEPSDRVAPSWSLDIGDIKLGRIPCRGLVPSQGTPFLLSRGRGREAIDEHVDQPRAEFMVDGKPPFECQRWGRGGSHTMSCPELVDSRGRQGSGC